MKNKIIMWTLMFIVLAASVLAVEVYDDKSYASPLADSGSVKKGLMFQALIDSTFIAANLTSTADVTKCYLYDINNSWNEMATTTSITNRIANFSAGTLDLTANNWYGIACDDQGAEWNARYGTGNYPETKTNVKYHLGIISADAKTNSSADAYMVKGVYTEAVDTGSSTINVSTPSPATNTWFNTENVNFNLTVNSTGIFNCSIYINETLNTTYDSIAAGTDVFVNITLNGFETGHYKYKFSCYNSSDYNNYNSNTSEVSFGVDVTNPSITSSFVNRSIFLGNISGSFLLQDTIGVFTYNISIDGKTIQSTTSINNKSYDAKLEYKASNLASGIHNLSVYVADGHTATELLKATAYNPSNGLFNDYIKYSFEEPYNIGYVRIKQKDSSLTDSWSTELKEDRYTFKFKPSVPNKKIYLRVTSDKYIHIIHNPRSIYKTWLIVDTHWLDFYPYETEFERISDNEIEVILTLEKAEKELEFNSIGDLNIVEKSYIIYTVNSTVTYQSVVTENGEQTITFRIEKPAGIINSTSATLKYNITSKSVNKQSFPTYDLYSSTFTTPSITGDTAEAEFNWSYTITGLYGLDTGVISNNQTITKILIDNCSTYTTRAMNFTLRDIDTNALVVGNISGYFEVWMEAISNYRPFNLTWNGGSQYGICISPAVAEYTAYAQLEYAATGYDTKTYYFNNVSLTNQSKNVTLFLTNQTSLVTFTVLDQDDDPLKDVLIKVLTYDVGTDSSEVTEILKTDSDGEAIGNIVLNTQWYKFILELDGDIVFESDPVKITSTSKTFRVNTATNYFNSYGNVKDTIGDVYFTNSTKTFTFTFSETTGSSVKGCLKVIRRIMAGDTTLATNCTTSSAATLTYIITENVSSNTYIGTGYVVIEGEDYVIDVESVSFNERYKDWGLEGIFVTFLIVITLVMVGVSSNSPTISVAMMMLGFITSVMLTIFFLNWSVLIVFIIAGGLTLFKLSRN